MVKWKQKQMESSCNEDKNTASSLSLKYRNHMFIPDEHDKVRFNFEDKNDWLRELVEKNLVNYLMTEIFKEQVISTKTTCRRKTKQIRQKLFNNRIFPWAPLSCKRS